MFPHSALPRTFDAAVRDLGDGRLEARKAAARDLARHTELHLDAVIEALTRTLAGDGSGEVRAAAALALADVGSTTAVPALIEAVLNDEHVDARQMALAALGELGDPRAVDVTRRALGDSEAPVRFAAVMAFVRVCEPHAEVVEALLEATEDDDPLVVHIALRMAEELGGSDEQDDVAVPPELAERALELLDHPSGEVQVASAVIRARCGHEDGHDTLVAVARGEIHTREAEDEAAAIEQCGLLGIEAAAEPLLRRGFSGWLTLKRDPFTWQARVALAAMEHPRAVEWIQRELGASSRERRILAAAAAGRAGVTAARKQLLALRRRAQGVDREVVDDALEAIDALEQEEEGT